MISCYPLVAARMTNTGEEEEEEELWWWCLFQRWERHLALPVLKVPDMFSHFSSNHKLPNVTHPVFREMFPYHLQQAAQGSFSNYCLTPTLWPWDRHINIKESMRWVWLTPLLSCVAFTHPVLVATDDCKLLQQHHGEHTCSCWDISHKLWL